MKLIDTLIKWFSLPEPKSEQPPAPHGIAIVPKDCTPIVSDYHWTKPHSRGNIGLWRNNPASGEKIYIDLPNYRGRTDLGPLPVHPEAMSDLEATTDHFDEIAEAGRIEREGRDYDNDLFLNLWDYLLELELSKKK